MWNDFFLSLEIAIFESGTSYKDVKRLNMHNKSGRTAIKIIGWMYIRGTTKLVGWV